MIVKAAILASLTLGMACCHDDGCRLKRNGLGGRVFLAGPSAALTSCPDRRGTTVPEIMPHQIPDQKARQ